MGRDDIAKVAHQVLIEAPDGRRRAMRIANTAARAVGQLSAGVDATVRHRV
jgi:hypothetical protein